MLSAVKKGDAKKLAELIKQDPGFDVNMGQDGDRWTLLHYACWGSTSFPVIPLLLAHPDVDVNAKARYGETPFYYACYGRPSCVREMLKDPRVKVNEPDLDGYTPLRDAAVYGYIDVIKMWIASGREIDLGTPGNEKTDAMGEAMKNDQAEVVTLLDIFKENPEETRHTTRVELGFLGELVAEMFAIVVFVSDGLLQFNDINTPSPAARFFSIVTQIPLELQMVLCNRAMGSAKEIIPGRESESAFKDLAKKV